MGLVFISYRRKDSDFAHRLADTLSKHVFDEIFIDLDIKRDRFDIALEEKVRACDVFALVVTENTFAERIHNQGDWIHREIKLAMDKNKPVVLILVRNTSLPAASELPADIRGILKHQGIIFYNNYFHEAIEKLARHCHHISNEVIRVRRFPDELPPVPRREDDPNAAKLGRRRRSFLDWLLG